MEHVKEPIRLPARDRDGHKGHYGKVLVLAGSPRMTGAAHLASRAALRGGAGLVTLGVPERIHPVIAAGVTSVMTLPLPATGTGTFAEAALELALEFLGGCDAFALGPGLDRHPETDRFVTRIVETAPCPGAIDADALNALAAAPYDPGFRVAGVRVITPHPGEAARLLGSTTAEIAADREGAVEKLARARRAVAVLKGRGTLVTDGKRLYENDTGNPGMATAGSGDVLTGLLAALLGQGLGAFDAAALAVRVHGRAGDLAAGRLGEISVTADDILAALPEALREAGA